jgi:hypothetical protein
MVTPRTSQGAPRNTYNLQEFAGAFGDLGTLIPFVVGYITVNHMDPAGILVGFGVFKLWAGLYFKTPVPIQPMKAIGTAAITHGAIFASGLFTGVVWGLMGLSGAVTWIQKITRRPVVQGIVLGLGLGFVVEGVKMMRGDLLLAAIDLYVAVERPQHREAPVVLLSDDGTVIGAMRAKVANAAGRAVYALRKTIVEPVFGQIKAGPQAFRRFSFRGLRKVRAEWLLVWCTHNLLKLFRAGWRPQIA